MKDFARVLRLAARRRATLIGCLATSLLVALLWGLNIGTLYPMVEIVFQGNGVPQHVDAKLAESREQIAACDARIAELTAQAAAEADPVLRQRLEVARGYAQTEKAAYAKSRDWLQWLQPWAHRHLPATPFGTLAAMIGLLMAGTAIKLVALTINLMLVQDLSLRAANDVRAMFFRKALRLDLDEFGDSGSAGLTSRLTNDIGHLTCGITVLLGRLVREPLKMIVCVGGAAWMCWRLLLLTLIVTPLVVLVMHALSRSIRRASRRVMDEMTQLYGMLSEAFAGIRVIKAYNTQAFERARFARGVDAYYRKSMKMAMYNTLTRSTSELLGMAVVSMAILAGGYLVVRRQTHLLGIPMSPKPLEPGEVLLFFAFLIGASDPARKLSDVWSSLQRGIAAASRVYEIIDRPVRVSEPLRPRAVARPHGRLVFDDISFRYPAGPPVLQGFSLAIDHGETVAVVGPNGSGKSTLVSLLCRFDDPQQGRLMLDGVPLNEISVRDLRRRLGLVTQRTVLFDDSILNNIRYGLPKVDRAQVVAAARRAYADEFICEKTPHGYDTVLGQHGVRLSGGQMQRIALARAFLRDPDILILDEATSQIDLESERLIHAALRAFLVGRTGLMITHRATTLELADRVAVIESGRLTAVGKPSQLAQQSPFYRSICGSERPRAA